MLKSAKPGPAEITGLLKAWGNGDQAALERLTPLVYTQLRRMARGYMRNAQPLNTVQATALVHEAYLRLVDVTSVDRQDRAHFFAVSAQLMRRILVDAARARGAVRRDAEIAALNDALNALSQWDPRKAQVVQLRFFGGLSVEETSEVLKVSPQTVKRDWSLARA